MIETMPISTPCLIDLETEEITALCPINNLPDFGSLKIQYMADASVVELKSLKEFLATYRNLSISQEDFAATILENLKFACNPLFINLELKYRVRGGIGTVVSTNWERNPTDPWETSDISPKTITELVCSGQVGILTIEDNFESHSSPVNFVYIQNANENFIHFLVNGKSKKAKMLMRQRHGSFVIHHEYPEPENWQKTSSLILSGPVFQVPTTEMSRVRGYFEIKYNWFVAMEELCKDKLHEDIILCLQIEKEIYSNGEGIMNPGGQ